MKYIKKIFDVIFSFEAIFVMCGGALVLSGFALADELDYKMAKVGRCYNKGMVLVKTDAGERCVEPKKLSPVR